MTQSHECCGNRHAGPRREVSLGRGRARWWLAGVAVLMCGSSSFAQIGDYPRYEALTQRLVDLANAPVATLESLGNSREGRAIHLLVIGTGDVHRKPAVLCVGQTSAPHLASGELACELAANLIERSKTDSAVKTLLDAYTFYIVPRPNPDGVEKLWRTPARVVDGNARPTDDDRDFSFGEDPPDDLNADGLITLMRVEDPLGTWIAHPQDPRVMVRADSQLGELGRYLVYPEGRDDDHDRAYNEDAGDGVSLQRNFTFDYPYFEAGAGPNQVSEPESRALVDFAFEHPNIALVLVFSPDDNLNHPWKAIGSEGTKPERKSILPADAPWCEQVATLYGEKVTARDAPEAPLQSGGLLGWSHHHYGRWAFGTPGWWIPTVKSTDRSSSDTPANASDANPGNTSAGNADTSKTDAGKTDAGDATESTTGTPAEKTSTEQPAAGATDGAATDDRKGASKVKVAKTDTRGAAELRFLKWMDAEHRDGFVNWTRVNHPDFPGQVVEVGGICPLAELNPDRSAITALAGSHADFVVALCERLPRLELVSVKRETFAAGLTRVTAVLRNTGRLPTMSARGAMTGLVPPLQIELQGAESAKFLDRARRSNVQVLAPGEAVELEWLLTHDNELSPELTLRAWSPAVGEATAQVPAAVAAPAP